MHPYQLPNGNVMYFPTKMSDRKDQEEGKIGVNNLLIRSGYPGALEPEDGSILAVDGIILSKNVNVIAKSIVIFEEHEVRTGYMGGP